ncbi:MAG: hypothetical protein HRU15_15890, partial [Planctomycetes bacterium]|nr:hypothetical protein [Planctomycetota bacterium]
MASTLFISLMGVSAMAFQRIASGGDKAMQVIKLHSMADIFLRNFESDVRNIPPVAAMHLQNTTEPYTLTFMRPVADTHTGYFNLGRTV